MAASLAGARMQTSFLGASLRRSTAGAAVAPAPRSLTVVAAHGDLPKIGGGRKWEHVEVNHNGKPVKVKMHVRTGDTVQVIAGKDKGVVGEIERVLTKKGLVVIKGVNIKTRNEKPKNPEEQGSQRQVESPVHHSNVMHYSKEKGVRSRVAHKVGDDGKKVRYLVKTGEALAN